MTSAAQGRQPQAAGIAPDTPIQKVLHPTIADLYRGNVVVPGRFEPHRTTGFCTRFQDVATRTAADIAESYGLDRVPGWPLGGPVHVLRFRAGQPALYRTSYGGNTIEGARRMGSTTVLPPPFLGTGYTPSRSHVIPEYLLDLIELPAGTEMWQITESGEEQRVARYIHRQSGWVNLAGAAFGPAGWWPPPAPLRPAVRRGIVARFRGEDFDADPGPASGQLTLHPLPGRPAPADFDDNDGIHTAVISDTRFDEVMRIRQLCTWRSAPFELLDVGPNQAVLHFIGDDHEIASELGLTQVDYCVWRAIASRSELSEIRIETTNLGVQGVFGSA